MEYIRITEENIDKEHICCAMSGKQSEVKKQWMKERFRDGLVFYRSAERGKCFIEYIPTENAWVPIDADGYVYINCLWIAGSRCHTYDGFIVLQFFTKKRNNLNFISLFCFRQLFTYFY